MNKVEINRKELANLLEHASNSIGENSSIPITQNKSYENKVISDWKSEPPKSAIDIPQFQIAKHLLLVTIDGHSISTILATRSSFMFIFSISKSINGCWM